MSANPYWVGILQGSLQSIPFLMLSWVLFKMNRASVKRHLHLLREERVTSAKVDVLAQRLGIAIEVDLIEDDECIVRVTRVSDGPRAARPAGGLPQ